MEQSVPPSRSEILRGDSETNSGLDYCTEFLDHIARANEALVQLQRRCSADPNVDDKKKIRTYKNRENYRLIIQQSVNTLLDEVTKLGPCPDHDFNSRTAETTEMEQSQDEGQIPLRDSYLPTLISQCVGPRVTMENELYTSQHEAAPKPIRRMSSPFLNDLPAEIRLQIYVELLESPRSIRGGELVEEKATALIVSDQAYESLAIDAAILRTCHQIYHEALPTLYQVNHFGFHDARSLRVFRSGGLPLVASSAKLPFGAPAFGLSPNQHGRLSLIRHLSLRFSHKYSRCAAFEYQMYKTSVGWSDRNYAHSEWAELLHGNRRASPTKKISFPALETLLLDFSEWSLTACEGLATRPFIEMFKNEKPLKSLMVVGMEHAATNRELKEALVMNLGTFKVGPYYLLESHFWDKERPWMNPMGLDIT